MNISARTSPLLRAFPLLGLVLAADAFACVDYSTYMQCTGAISTPFAVNDVLTAGSYAFAALQSGGVQVLDLTQPDQPLLVATAATGASRGLAYRSGRLYVAGGVPGMRVVDAADPVHPVVLSTVNTPGSAIGVDVVGTIAYVADNTAGLQVIDASGPLTPTIVGHVALPGTSVDVAVQANLAFVASEAGGWSVIDVTVPTAPLLLSTTVSGVSRAVEPFAHYVAVGAASGDVRIYDVINPAAPVLLGSLSQTDEIHRMAIRDNTLYVPTTHDPLYGAPGSLCTIDLADPSHPSMIGRTGVWGDVRSVALRGDRAYAGSSDATFGLAVVDVSSSETPGVLGQATAPLADFCVARDGLLYVPEQSLGLAILDASDPSAPTQLALLNTPGAAWGACLIGGYLLVADVNNGLITVDVSNPAAPVALNTLSLPGGARDVQTVGSVAYVLTQDGICSFDVSDPVHPSELSCLPATYPTRITLAGSRMYVTENINGLEIVDISDPAHLVAMGTIVLPSSTLHCAAYGDYVFVSGSSGQLHIVDATVPTAPILAETIQLMNSPSGLLVDGTALYVADNAGGVVVMDVTNPLAPQSISGNVWTDRLEASFLTLDGDNLIAIDNGHGLLRILPSHCPTAADVDQSGVAQNRVIEAVFPNPSSGVATIELAVNDPGAWTVQIFDPSGRRVSDLSKQSATRWGWDGRDSAGRLVPAGIYYVSCSSGERHASRPIVRLNPR